MSRLLAAVLLLLSLPWLVLRLCCLMLVERAVGQLSYSAQSGFWEWQWADERLPLRLLTLATGRLRWLGPQYGSALSSAHPAGLFSPAQLQASMGISASSSDLEFFSSATVRQKLALVLKSLLALGYRTQSGSPETPAARIFGVQFSNTTMADAVAAITDAAQPEEKQVMQRVFFVNADCLNIAYRDRDYHFLLHDADMVLPDGSGVRLGLKWLGTGMQDNLNGTDLFPHLCEAASQLGLRLYFLGGQPGIAAEAAQKMQQEYPALQVAGARDGYFTEDEKATVLAEINASSPDLLLLGMGAPRQERWLSDNAADLNVAVGVGVGGLFDYYSGAVARAPLWLRELGLEWVWRILQQPGDKWRRYVVGNPLFLSRVLRQRLALGERSWTSLPDRSAMQDWVSVQRSSRFEGWLAPVKILWWRLSLGAGAVTKRALDLLVAVLALSLLSPVLLGLAMIVKFTSPGPVTYQQIRIGRRGKPFVMHKFRSMYCDADERLQALAEHNESSDGVLFKMANDPRVTPVGRWMRRFSVDELPQLFNVLNGSMSLVGPRPALPSEVDEYESVHLKRLQGNPGLTCWWQVSGRSDLSFKEQIELDIRYMKNQSIGEDLRLLARTVPAVIGGKGAY